MAMEAPSDGLLVQVTEEELQQVMNEESQHFERF